MNKVLRIILLTGFLWQPSSVLFAEEAKDTVTNLEDCSKLKFYGDVDAEPVSEIQNKVITCLDADVATELSITSPGGAVDYASAFYDAVMTHPNRQQLTTIATGGVSSAAVTMYMAGETRLVTRYATILIHMVSYGLDGNYTIRDLEEIVEDAKLDQFILSQVVSERSGMEQQAVMTAMYRGTSYNAEEALDLGIATSIMKYPGL